MRIFKGLGIFTMLLFLLSCSKQAYESITGYAVAYSDDKVLIVEARDHSTSSQIRDAVWVSRLKEERVGSLLTVQLGDGYDSYPRGASAKKVKQEQQLAGEKDVIKTSLDYANNKWHEGIAVIDSIEFDTSQKQWSIEVGNIFNDLAIALSVGKDNVVTER